MSTRTRRNPSARPPLTTGQARGTLGSQGLLDTGVQTFTINSTPGGTQDPLIEPANPPLAQRQSSSDKSDTSQPDDDGPTQEPSDIAQLLEQNQQQLYQAIYQELGLSATTKQAVKDLTLKTAKTTFSVIMNFMVEHAKDWIHVVEVEEIEQERDDAVSELGALRQERQRKVPRVSFRDTNGGGAAKGDDDKSKEDPVGTFLQPLTDMEYMSLLSARNPWLETDWWRRATMSPELVATICRGIEDDVISKVDRGQAHDLRAVLETVRATLVAAIGKQINYAAIKPSIDRLWIVYEANRQSSIGGARVRACALAAGAAALEEGTKGRSTEHQAATKRMRKAIALAMATPESLHASAIAGEKGSLSNYVVGAGSRQRGGKNRRQFKGPGDKGGAPKDKKEFGGKCFKCDKSGHRAADCKGKDGDS